MGQKIAESQLVNLSTDELNHLNANYPVDLDLGDRVLTLNYPGSGEQPARLIDEREPTVPRHLTQLSNDPLGEKINAIITYLQELARAS
tara:strand:+ start:521 stop:787 length:267 start_codon:yes stop_codon:yes gene_type:complete